MGLRGYWSVGVSVVAVGCAAALLHAPAAPAAEPGPPPAAFHGTWSDNMSIHVQQGQAASRSRLDDVADAGVGLIRQYVWWDRIETSPGHYDWAVLDAVVGDAAQRGVTVLPTLLYPPAFHTPSRPDAPKGLYPPDDPQDMADFATAMVQRYGPEGDFWNCTHVPPIIGELQCPEPYRPIGMWEVWNEPDYPSWWKGQPDPTEYLPLLEAANEAIKAVDPQALVVVGSLTNSGSAFEGRYLDQLYDLGAAEHFDVLAVNPYAHDVGALLAFVKGARAIATEHGDGDVPILITEYGWASAGRSPYIVVDEGCQAALLHAATREITQRRDELGILGAIQFQWHDVPTTSQAWPHHAGVRRSDGTAKPARAALAAATAGQAAPSGATLETACPEDRHSLDGDLHRLTVEMTGSADGTVRSSPSWLECEGRTCSSQVQPGPITVTVNPEEGARVVAWRGAPECTGEVCVIDVDQDRTIAVELSSAAGVGQYQESSAAVTYEGTWRAVRDARDRAGASRRAPNGPATASLRFWGQGVRWISRRGPTSGRNDVFVDGVRAATVDRYARSTQFRRRVFDSGALAPGEHTIRIVHTGRKNRLAKDDNIWLDAFVVY